jgi:cell division protein FtsI (penicillin-binding protein 3)
MTDAQKRWLRLCLLLGLPLSTLAAPLPDSASVVQRRAITDRAGIILAHDFAAYGVCVNPARILAAPDRLLGLLRALERTSSSLGEHDFDEVKSRLARDPSRERYCLVRHMAPETAAQLADLQGPEIFLQPESVRFYPAGEVTGAVLGFTNIDNTGQEGLELAFEDQLRRREMLEGTTAVGESTPFPESKSLTTTIDLPLQALLYEQVRDAAERAGAHEAAGIVLDIRTRQVRAVASFPTFNPNDRSTYTPARFRNRAIVDLFQVSPAGHRKSWFTVGLPSGRCTTRN